MATTSRPSWVPDPNTTNRRDYTTALLSKPIPDNADRKFKTMYEQQSRLLNLLINHKAMEPNLEQTFMTPANRKSRIYFMWDFVQRTVAFLNMVEHPEQPNGTAWGEAVGRGTMGAGLITDTSGMTDMIPWGGEVTALAREIESS